MPTPKHTPGPWEDDNTLRHYSTRVIRHNGILVARLQTLPTNDLDNDAEIDANARLLKAAPDLAEALRAMLEHEGERGVNGIGMEYDSGALERAKGMARAALAKAGL